MGMTPVNMPAVDRMGDETAAQSEQGAENIGDAVRKNLHAPESRSAIFGRPNEFPTWRSQGGKRSQRQ